MSPIQSVEHACSDVQEPLKPLMLFRKTWAVVGARAQPDKYGFKIVRRLKSLGYTVYPVNPKIAQVDGLTCYPSLESLPQVPDVVDLVISPKSGMDTLKAAAGLGIRLIWAQPGTHDEAFLTLARSLDLCVLEDCVLNATEDRVPEED